MTGRTTAWITKTGVGCCLAILLSLVGTAPHAVAQTAADSAAIRAAALDYIEGWYAANPDRMARAVHSELAKRLVRHTDGSVAEVTAEQLVDQTARGGGSSTPASEQSTLVEILDIYENAASVRVTAHEWVDYMHLARFDGRWQIYNVLWELSSAGKERLEAAMRARESRDPGDREAEAGERSDGDGEEPGRNDEFREEFLRDFDVAARKFVQLASAMPEEAYTWRPGSGVASVGEVFVHVARYNYWYPESSLDYPAPPEIDARDMEERWKGRSKDAIAPELERSMAHVRELVGSLSAEDLQAPTRLYGRSVTTRAVLFQLLTHMHEHLGQSVAYARSNGIVPPWSR